MPQDKLTDFYGSGAFPINYPNEWDRIRGRNGYGIWLHGTPRDTYSRPPRASDGCIVLSNEDLDLHSYV
jgi:murein L,D-transpeptidase YafK